MSLNHLTKSQLIEKLQEQVKNYDALYDALDNIPNIAIFAFNEKRKITFWNKISEKQYGYTKEYVIDKHIENVIMPSHLKEMFVEEINEVLCDKQGIINGEMEHIQKDGSIIMDYSNMVLMNKGDNKEFFCINFDFAKLNKLKKPVFKLPQNGNQNVVEMANILIFQYDKEGIVKEYNSYAQMLLGYTKEEIIGKNWIDLLVESNYKERARRFIKESYKKKIISKYELPLICKNGVKKVIFWKNSFAKDIYGIDRYMLSVGLDVTERKSVQDQMEFLANYDDLTRLPNRNLLYKQMEESMNHAVRFNHRMMLMFLDINNFKMINNSLGHSLGDELIINVADRITQKLRLCDFVARFGNDEFALVFDNVENDEAAQKITKRVLELFDKPINLGEHEIYITVSCGVSFFPTESNDIKSLMKNTDLALFHAKDKGKNSYCFFEYNMIDEITKQMMLESYMRKSIENNEFYILYQPQIDVKSKKIIGIEALVRWNHPKLKTIPPLDFIPVAEDTGMILQIGQIVLQESIQQVKNWHNLGFTDLKLAVNISSVQMLQSNLLGTVTKILEETKFDPQYLELELTETVLMENIDFASTILKQFKEKNIRIAIDDFGTGYSSLNYLKNFPVDCIKIDKGFIDNIDTDTYDKAIVKAVITMGHSLGIEILAEGVENEEQMKILEHEKCDKIQGFYFSKPLEASTFEELMKNENIFEQSMEIPDEEFSFDKDLKKYKKFLTTTTIYE